MNLKVYYLSIVLLVSTAHLPGQQTPMPIDKKSQGDIATQPKVGTPFTPRMARSVARSITKLYLIKHYKLDPGKLDETAEAIARRIMEYNHKHDTPEGKDLGEALMVALFEMRANVIGGTGSPNIPPELAQKIGKLTGPLFPDIRNLAADLVADIRPKLETKQQLKLAADLFILNSSLDYIETVMQRWADGQISPYENPLDPSKGTAQNANKDTERYLKWANHWAQQSLPDKQWQDWKQYVEQAKNLYAFDDTQASTADSVLRECIKLSEQLAKDQDRTNRLLQSRVNSYLVAWLRHWNWDHPFIYLLQSDFEDAREPIRALSDKLKQQINKIPTEQQRKAANQRIAALLLEKGFDIEKD